MESYLGQIMLFAGNFAPVNFMTCSGQLLSISQYTALFAVIGTYYGGDGVQNFALPNLQGCVPIGTGTGRGLTTRVLGETGGSESVPLSIQQMPAHNHLLTANAASGNAPSPSGALLAQTAVPRSTTTYDTYFTGTPANAVNLAPTAVQPQGGNQPHANMQPFLAMTYCICINGLFPSRN